MWLLLMVSWVGLQCVIVVFPAVSYKRKYVHEALVNHSVKFAQEKGAVR